MKRLFPFFALILLLGTAAKPTDKDAAAFRRPANEYRPMPFWHLNGTLTRDTIVKQINRAKREAGFGGIAVLPVSGTRPEYLTDAYFERYDDMIETMHRNGMELIIYDDIDLEVGKIRIKGKGSAGTHNGMRNIIYLLGRDDFPRLRVGIGRPPEGWDLKDYVLTGYRTPAERQTMFDAFVAAAETVERLIAGGNDAARARVAEYNNG